MRNNVHVLLDGERLVVSEAERRLNVAGGGIWQRAADKGETYQQAVEHFVKRRDALRPA